MSNFETGQASIDTISRLTQAHEKLDVPQVKKLLEEIRLDSESYSKAMLDRAIASAIEMKDSKEQVATAFLGFAEKVQKDRQKVINGALKELYAELGLGQAVSQA